MLQNHTHVVNNCYTECMMLTKRCFIKLLLFLLFASFWIFGSDATSTLNELSEQDVTSYMQDVLAEYQVSLRRSAFENRPQRKRRSLDVGSDHENNTKG